MKCPLCKYDLDEGATQHPLCGWAKPVERPAPSRERTGWRLCAWHHNRCNMFGSCGTGGGQWLCGWHHYFARALSNGLPAGLTDLQLFEEWLAQFRPDGAYGMNPGQWWAHAAILWDAVNGTGENPVKTWAIDRELHERYRIAWWAARGVAAPDLKKPRLEGRPLPPWTPPPIVTPEELTHA